ncbi:hypothetical protein [Halobacillus naozhouensis]|uniref:Uncharacterized protein n=1 Tax=Halobacillus naozhouensis TaxID=554880 RepID=A0ABY8IWA3_9BACI|nr:hypothetical protein [Halobacillus naozhouensis]WFT74493.1 hypothetical protein P9989_19410 [Halobacillus naozhouensis]
MEMIEKYGSPNEATMSRLIWYNNGPWKRTIVYRDTVPHNFPTPHPDFLEQVIDYRIPVHLADELTWFDGSVYIDRTAGEVSAKCHMEAMNTLSLNLVHDIVIGTRTVDKARMFYAEVAENYAKSQQTCPYTERLLFPEQRLTNDPGISYFDC